MNLLCPNCQKMLTVQEDFAGQLMKCPLCNGAFTVPGLPGAASPPAVQPEPEIYSLRPEPLPPSAPPPPPHVPSLSLDTEAAPPPPQKPPQMQGDHQRILSVSLNPRMLPWIAPVCLLVVFLLQFLDWDGVYPGGQAAVTGNAWYAAFGAYSRDNDLKTLVQFIDDEKYKPGASVLTIFYLLLFFPALLVTIASVVISIVQVKLPPLVEKILPWRWGIVAAVNFILFLFLGLQVLVGFSLDSRYRDWVDEVTKRETQDNPTTPERKLADVHRGVYLEGLRHTVWLRLVVLLHLTAIVSSALMFWIDRRGRQRPLPKLELRC